MIVSKDKIGWSASKLFSWVKNFTNMQKKKTKKTKRNILSKIIFFWKNKYQIYKKNYIGIFWPHLDHDFNLVAIFKLVISLFRQVLKTCRYLILNPSWGANQWCNVRKVKKITNMYRFFFIVPMFSRLFKDISITLAHKGLRWKHIMVIPFGALLGIAL